MLTPVHHILPLTIIVRERLLPVTGRVTAHVNQKVTSLDVIAEADWAREHVLLDIARTLHLTTEAADGLIQCKVGDQIPAGAQVAAGKGLFARKIHAPRAGRVVAAGGGQVLLEVGETRLELHAGIPGTIVQIIPDRGAIIQTTGALIQGVWGNGRIDSGQLINLAEKPDGILTAERLDVSLRGAIILAGLVKDEQTLQVGAELLVRGLILSSISPVLMPMASEMHYPIVVTDGFGEMPMNSAAYKLLNSNVKREVTLNAEAYDRYTGARPEVIIPLTMTQLPPMPDDVLSLAPGQQVRMRRPPAAGAMGTLVAIKPGLTLLPSGLHAPAAVVKIENGESVIVPLVNLEVVG
jgi:hypothetical protein